MGTEGTKEWADWNYNIFKGCSNNCRYCYAKFMAKRFDRIKSFDEWRNPVLSRKVYNNSFKKRKGRGMFPTTHDITPYTYAYCITMLQGLLRVGNEILITTKPNFHLIKMLCKAIKPYKKQVQFRFTITSMDDKKLEYWEENAPNYKSRKDSLIHAFGEGFKTSVSIEPYLDATPMYLINDIYLYCTESIWIGIMNPKYNYGLRSTHIYNEVYVRAMIEDLVEVYSIAYPNTILKKLRLKDSIRNMGISL